jgi:hypothetical protein
VLPPRQVSQTLAKSTILRKEVHVSFVYIINRLGKPLMPCGPRKAKLLLKSGKAKVVKMIPFTLQLLYGSSGYTQEVALGIDAGTQHRGDRPDNLITLCESCHDLIHRTHQEQKIIRKSKSLRDGACAIRGRCALSLAGAVRATLICVSWMECTSVRVPVTRN